MSVEVSFRHVANVWVLDVRDEIGTQTLAGVPKPRTFVAAAIAALEPAVREAVLRAAAKAAGLRVLTEAQATFVVEYSDDCLGEIARQGAYVGGHSDYAETIRERAQKAADVLAALRGEEVPQP